MDPNELDVKPAHKITYTDGSKRYIYWYTKSGPSCRDFDKMRNGDFVKQIYEDGIRMPVGADADIATRDGGKYYLRRIELDQFVVEALN